MSTPRHHRSPFQVVHKEVIETEERNLRRMRATYGIKVNEGSMSAWTAQNLIAQKEYVISLLKKADPVKQKELFTKQ